MPSNADPLKRAIQRWALDVVDEATDLMVPAVAGEAPRQTGELADSIRAKNVHQRGTRYQGGLEATVIQAVTTDQGARPHVIRPRTPGGRLVFHWPKVGRVVAFARVNHPGNPARPWWADAHRRHWRRSLVRAASGRRLR